MRWAGRLAASRFARMGGVTAVGAVYCAAFLAYDIIRGLTLSAWVMAALLVANTAGALLAYRTYRRTQQCPHGHRYPLDFDWCERCGEPWPVSDEEDA